MKNFPITVEDGELAGQTFWVSRAVAVIGCIFTFLDGNWCVLANKRGEGTPDFQGMWNMPCGYLDFDETTKEAVIREVYEETGVKIPEEYLHFWTFNDSPSDNRQNVTFRYYAILNGPEPGSISIGTGNGRGGEKDEVEAIGWIPIKDIDNYKWAFNHTDIIKDFADCYCLEVDNPTYVETPV